MVTFIYHPTNFLSGTLQLLAAAQYKPLSQKNLLDLSIEFNHLPVSASIGEAEVIEIKDP